MKKISNKLAKNILATVAYYDVLDYPLTLFEIWKYLIRIDYFDPQKQVQKISIADILKEFEQGMLGGFVAQKNGYYFLKGREELVEKKVLNGKITAVKLKKLTRSVGFLRFVPFVRMVGVTGRMAMKNASIGSDWDLLIVLKTGRIWTGRTLVTMLAQLMGKRRYGKKIKDRLCLNYFITDSSLEIITKDLFSANEYLFLFPLFGWETYQRFQIKNKWIRNMKPTYELAQVAPFGILRDSFLSKNIRMIGEAIFDSNWLENFLGKIERKKIMQNPKTAKEGSLVHADNDALIFLPEPHGPAVFEKFKNKLSEIGS